MSKRNECFLCEEGQCYLTTLKGDSRVYCSLSPDLDPDSQKPLHVLVAPTQHYVSIFEMPEEEYVALMLAVRRVQDFYQSKGYGPMVTELRLDPAPHTPHVHIHLVFSSDSLRPLRTREKTPVEESFLASLKREITSLVWYS